MQTRCSRDCKENPIWTTPSSRSGACVQTRFSSSLTHLLANLQPKIAEFLIQNRLPSIYTYREQIIGQGASVSYATNYYELFRRAATRTLTRSLVVRSPADLPVQLPTKFELVINLKTANALGLTVPPMLLARADEVIE